jgi:hypothetical protein
VHYENNSIGCETIDSSRFDFCIVEGTYTMLLKNTTYKVFIENSFIDTKSNRVKRARDIMNDFNEKVLEIEHNIINEQSKYANMLVKNEVFK